MLRSRPRLLAAACSLTLAASVSVATPGGDPRDPLARASLRRADHAATLRALQGDEAPAAPDHVAAARRAADRRIKKLQVEPGDLLTASERQYAALRIVLEEPPAAKRARLKTTFLPRGVDFDAERGLLAVAAVSQVLLYDLVAGGLEVLAAPAPEIESFDFVNDVLFDGEGRLLIADIGAVGDASEPADGALWSHDLESGTMVQIGTRRDWANPALLAADSAGVVHVVDRGAGPLLHTVFDDRWDAVYRLTGKKRLRVKEVWTGSGVQATAYDIDASDRHWFANVTDIAILEDELLTSPCGVSVPFRFVTGLVTGEDGAWILDGADVRTTQRRLFRVESDCSTVLLSEVNKLRKSRGLARVPDPAS